MSRHVRKIVLVLVLGAIVNVAVAWGCRICRSDQQLFDDADLVQPDDSTGYLRAEFSFGFASVSQVGPDLLVSYLRFFRPIPLDEFRAMIPSASKLAENKPLDSSVFGVRESFAGWPCLSVYGTSTATISMQSSSKGIFDLAKYTSLSPPRSEVPYLPVWPGFAVNTMFYAMILWGLLTALFALRRRRRIKRGLCTNCAYDLRGGSHQRCPECGTV